MSAFAAFVIAHNFLHSDLFCNGIFLWDIQQRKHFNASNSLIYVGDERIVKQWFSHLTNCSKTNQYTVLGFLTGTHTAGVEDEDLTIIVLIRCHKFQPYLMMTTPSQLTISLL